MGTTRSDRREAQTWLRLDRALASLASEPASDDVGVSTENLDAPRTLILNALASLDEAFDAALATLGLAEACMALARHLESDAARWQRLLQAVVSDPTLQAARNRHQQVRLNALIRHFETWEAATPEGQRAARFQAAWVVATLQTLEDTWVRQHGRPILPVLMHEGLALLWPALYQRVRHLKT